MTANSLEGDTAALESYLSAELGADVAALDVLSEKLNLVVAVRTESGGVEYVLHQPRKLRDTPLFIDHRREYEVLDRLREMSIPTQTPVSFCDDASVLDEPFFVTTYLDGEPVPLGNDLPERFRDPPSRERVATDLIETLADIHRLDVGPFEDVCERHTPRAQARLASDRLDAVARVTGREFPRLRSVGEWLLANAPDDSETTLVHGDFRPGNVLLAGAERPEVGGVLDWESTMLGDPLTEVGYLLLRWRDDGDPTLPLDELEGRYSNDDALDYLRDANERGLCPFSAKPGSPTRRDLVARYEDEIGFVYEHDRFYRAQAAFLLATVWADLHRHDVEAGLESDREPYVEYMAMLAERIADGEFRL